jgi:hypothetical protein
MSGAVRVIERMSRAADDLRDVTPIETLGKSFLPSEFSSQDRPRDLVAMRCAKGQCLSAAQAGVV